MKNKYLTSTQIIITSDLLEPDEKVENHSYNENIDIKEFLEARKKKMLAEARDYSDAAIREKMKKRTLDFYESLKRTEQKKIWEMSIWCNAIILLFSRIAAKVF